MKFLPLAGLAFCLASSACETTSSIGQASTHYITFAGGAFSWNIETSNYGSWDYQTNYIHLRNNTVNKYRVIGVADSVNAPYVDENQPGAFNIILYPGQTATLLPDVVPGSLPRQYPLNGNVHFYVVIASYAPTL
jgi:hypothetical protein